MSKTVAILQSNYIPWKGYFDLIAAVDEFILYDDMQYTKRDWRNRNQIKTPEGTAWLSVPVKAKGKFEQSIRETEIEGEGWRAQHLKSFAFNYRKAPHYTEIMALIEPLYAQHYTHLSVMNEAFLRSICDYLGIKTPIMHSWDYTLEEGKTERLVALCKQAGASAYISGPSAKDYIDPAQFEAAKIQLSWFDYSGYPAYPQLWGEFTHQVSILDLLFNCGKDAAQFMRVGRA